MCGREFRLPVELEDPGPCAIFDETDRALEAFKEPRGLGQAFEDAVSRVLRSPSATLRPDPLTVEDAFRCYSGSARDALDELRRAIGTLEEAPANETAGDLWPEKGSAPFRRLQLVALDGYQATMVSPGLTWGVIGDVQNFVDARPPS